MRQPLKGLSEDGWQPTPTLHCPQPGGDYSADTQRLRKNPACGYRILYGEIDPYATDR